jgi:hypothetical protein
MKLYRSVIALTVALVMLGVTRMIADDTPPMRMIPTCTPGKSEGTQLRSWRVRYIVPKNATVRQIKDIDYSEYRVLVNTKGKPEFLTLFLGNGSPYSLCSAVRHRFLKLPDGTGGIDARCITADTKESRSTGFENEYAYYDSVSADSAKYFDRIIDSMCYEAPKK